MKIVSVAYPFTSVSGSSVGGAEQVLHAIDKALSEAGFDSILIGNEYSEIKGKLVKLPELKKMSDETERKNIYKLIKEQIKDIVKNEKIDLIHMHGVDFREYYENFGVPVLVTLHLPISFYPDDIFDFGINYVCVSENQLGSVKAKVKPALIRNGVDTEYFKPLFEKENFLLAMGRICPEKGFHLALDAAVKSKTKILLAGSVFQFESHQKYFEKEIEPRLQNRNCLYIGPATSELKRVLFSKAKCLLVPSLVAETSSLVAMEALSSGTPVVAFRKGALPEIVENGKSGFLVDSFEEMVESITKCSLIDPEDCRKVALEKCRITKMTESYLSLYKKISGEARENQNY